MSSSMHLIGPFDALAEVVGNAWPFYWRNSTDVPPPDLHITAHSIDVGSDSRAVAPMNRDWRHRKRAQTQARTQYRGNGRRFGSIGFPQPELQAQTSAAVQVSAGVAIVAGAATSAVGRMTVAARSVHVANGFFINSGGWEYVREPGDRHSSARAGSGEAGCANDADAKSVLDRFRMGWGTPYGRSQLAAIGVAVSSSQVPLTYPQSLTLII